VSDCGGVEVGESSTVVGTDGGVLTLEVVADSSPDVVVAPVSVMT
jgi:hypothetical protein